MLGGITDLRHSQQNQKEDRGQLTRRLECMDGMAAKEDRLIALERLSTIHQQSLSTYVDLEGLDFTGACKATLRDGLISQDGSTWKSQWQDQPPYRDILFAIAPHNGINLSILLDRSGDELASASTSSLKLIELFELLFVGRTVTRQSISIFRATRLANDPVLTAIVLQLQDISVSQLPMTIEHLRGVLHAMSNVNAERLRTMLAPRIILVIQAKLDAMRGALLEKLKSSPDWAEAACTLQSLGEVLIKAAWPLTLVDLRTRNLLEDLPTQTWINQLQEIDLAGRWKTPGGRLLSPKGTLALALRRSCVSRLIDSSIIPSSLAQKFVAIWVRLHDHEMQELSIILTENLSNPFDTRWDCLGSLPELPQIALLHIHRLLVHSSEGVGDALTGLGAFLDDNNIPACWIDQICAYLRANGAKIGKRITQSMPVEKWFRFLHSIKMIYRNDATLEPEITDPAAERALPLILRQFFHSRIDARQYYLGDLAKFEAFCNTKTIDGASGALWCILFESRHDHRRAISDSLEALHLCEDNPQLSVMHDVLLRLEKDGSNSSSISDALTELGKASKVVIDTCERLLSRLAAKDLGIAQLQVASWEFRDDLSEDEVTSLMLIKNAINMPSVGSLTKADLDAGSKKLQHEFTKVMAEAERLNSLRVALRARDPCGTSDMLTKIGIKFPSVVDDLVSLVPSRLADLIEQT